MVYLFLANGFEEVEALAPLDLLRRAGVEVTTVGIGGDVITGAHGITVHADIPDGLYSDNAPEMVILPGGMPGSKHLDESRTVDVALKAAARNNGYIAAICAAPMILGKRELLEGKEATCYPGFEKELIGAKLSTEKVVVDGRIITAAGMGVAVDFGLELIKQFKDEHLADTIRRAIQCKDST